jgi:actin-related protein
MYLYPLNTTNKEKARIAQILFEKHNIKEVMMFNQPQMSCFSAGRFNDSSIVIECGEGSTQIIAFHDGQNVISEKL